MGRLIKVTICLLLIAAVLANLPSIAFAGDGLPIFESCMNGTPPLWVLGGVGGSWVAHFTSGIEDTAGQGWLRLTSNTTNQAGYAYYDYAFHSSYGIVVSFEYVSWGGTGADGVGFFLFDGSTQNFNIGDVGGSLGYANGCSVNGLSNAYVGIGLDEYGNFAYSEDRCKHGGSARTPDSVTVRGSGNGTLGYNWLTTVSVSSYGGIDIPGGSTRPNLTGANYRKVLMTITADKKLTVSVQFGASNPYTTLINNLDLAAASGQAPLPPTLKLGFFASTGASTNYHEIRNISAAVPADLAVTKTDGLTSVIPGDPITYTVTFSNNGPNDVQDAVVNDPVPASITGVTWTATASPGSSCGQYSGSGNNISTTVNLLNAGTATFTINGTVSQTISGPITNTATITPPVNISDSNPNNNSATDVDTAPPAVTTLGATGVGARTATLNGNLISKGSASSVTVSFQYATDAYYIANNGNYSSATGNQAMSATGPFSANLSGLSGATTYHFRARSVGDGTAYGDDMTFTTGRTPPAVVTNPATNVTTTSATLNGNLISKGTASTVNASFEWGETISYGSETTAQALTNTGTFSAPLTGLSPATTYHFRAKALGDGSAVGTDMAFTTLSTPPSVTTTGFSDVTTNLATLYGNLTSLGTASPVSMSFQYATDAYYTSHSNTYNSETTPQSMTSTGPYSSSTHSLLPGTIYHFRAKALGDGTSYGADMTFTTLTTPPSVTTNPATDLTLNSAKLNGNLTSLGTATSVSVSFQYATDAYYTGHENTYDNETSPSQSMDEPSNFTFNLNSLSAGTTYHFRAKAAGHGTAYGDDLTFTTNSTPPSVTTNTASAVGTSSATLNGNLDSLGSALSVNISFQYATDAYYVSHDNTYDSETTAQPMSSTGPFNIPLSSLSPSTTYHFRAKAVGHGTAYGGDMTFTTTQIMHTLTMAVTGSGSTAPTVGSYSYAEGSVVNISASPATGWHFLNWTGGVADPNSPSTTVTMDSDKTITANFAQDQYTLTINIVGQGSVSKVPNQATYTYGSVVNLTAAPQAGWSFSSWSGDLSGSTNPTSITMNGNRTVTATFTQIMHTLTMAVTGSGSTAPTVGSYSYAEGSVVNISASPATGWHFLNWSGGVANSNLPNTTITMDSDKTATANFAQDQYTLTINIVGQGSISKAPDQATYTYGTNVQLTANPQAGWSFSSWSSDLSGSTNPNTITMNGNRTVTATFTQIMHTLTMSVTGSGNTTPALGSYSYAEDSVVNISASPATGWHFLNWSGGVANSNLPNTTITMDSDKTVTANFAQDQYTLTIVIAGLGSVSKVPNQPTYTYGSVVNLTAAPQAGWSFSSWSGDLSGSTNPNTITMNSNRTVTANFSNSPAVATNSAQNVTSGSATLRGLLTSKGTASSVSVSFEWATDDYYTTHGSYDNETTPPWPMVSTGAFSFALGGLSPETTYHFRAKAIGDGIAYGVDMTFTTRPLQPPNQPPNVHPIQGALCVTLPTILQSAPFSDPDPGDTHTASQWQIRTNTESYASPVYDSGTNTLHLTSITLSETELDYSATYYWHVRHEDNHGAWSSWSEETYFMTADTRTGSDITVIREGTSIKFGEVNEGGCTWVTTSGTNPVGPTPPSIIATGSFTDVATTATHTGPIVIGIPYDPSATRNLQNLRLFHWNETSWEDVTTSVDTTNNIVYGEVNSLSWFFIGGQWVWIDEGTGVPVFPNVYIGICAVAGAGILAYFIRRRLLGVERAGN